MSTTRGKRKRAAAGKAAKGKKKGAGEEEEMEMEEELEAVPQAAEPPLLDDNGEEEEEEEPTKKRKRGTTTGRRSARAAPAKSASARPRRATTRNQRKEDDEEDEDEGGDEGQEDEAPPPAAATTRSTRASSRLRQKAEAPSQPAARPGLTEWERWIGMTRGQRRKWLAAGNPVPERPGQQSSASGPRPVLQRTGSFSKNDLLHGSYRDLFGLLQRSRGIRGGAPASSSSAGDAEAEQQKEKKKEDEAEDMFKDKWLVNPETGEFEDRWLLLNHHHWAVSFVQGNGVLCTAEEEEELKSLNLRDDVPWSVRRRSERRSTLRMDQGRVFQQKKRLAKGDIGKEVEDDIEVETDRIPLYLDPPEDGSCWIAELPTETLLHIFSYLPSGALARGMNVCRTWWGVLSDHHLWNQQCVLVEQRGVIPDSIIKSHGYSNDVNHVVFAFCKSGWEGQDIKPSMVQVTRGYPYQRTIQYNDSDFAFEEQTKWADRVAHHQLTSRGKEKDADLGFIKIQHKYPWTPVLEIPSTHRYSELWWFLQYQTRSSRQAKTVPFRNPDLWRWRLVHSDETELTGFVQFNIGHFEKLVKEGKVSEEMSKEDIDLIVTLLQDSYNTDVALYEQQTIPDWLQCKKREEMHTKSEPFRVDQPEGISATLYAYQKETLTWMKEVEEMVSRGLGWDIVSLLTWEDQTGSRVMFDVNGDVIAPSMLDKTKHIRTMTTRGGMLADEMGLGKTLVVLSLIMLQKAQVDKIIARDDQLQPLNEDTFRTKATLVVCPNHLCKQWESEIKKHTNPRLKTYVVNTVRAHEKTSYKDVMNADVVIVSFTFLSNNIYLTTKPSCTPEMVKKAAASDFDPLRSFAPVFHQFRWLRIILDEGHEVMTDAEGQPILGVMSDYQSVFRWYVTGTPFMAGINSLRAVLSYLQVKVQSGPIGNPSGSSTYTLPSIIERGAIRNLYCRHTKASVGNEYRLPGVEEEVILIKHTLIEKTLYEVARVEGRDKEMYQLCSHPQISNNQCRVLGSEQRNLDDIFVEVLKHKHDQIKDSEKELVDTKRSLKGHEKRLAEMDAEFRFQLAKDPNWKPSRLQRERKKGMETNIRRERRQILHLEKSLVNYQKSLELLEQMNKQRSSPSDAMIEAEKNENEGIVAPVPNARFMSSTEVEDDLIQQHGSKMAHLFVYVKQLCEVEENRIIIFSQWDRMLGVVGDILEENGIATVSCRGNVYRRNRAISAFQSGNNADGADKPRVLMLSLESAASGTNLTGATHILLVDPISGSRKRARAIEAQAIGRANRLGQTRKVKVVRFIVVDTVEFDAYVKNCCTPDADAAGAADEREDTGASLTEAIDLLTSSA